MNWVLDQPLNGTNVSLRQHYEDQSLGYVAAIWRRRWMIAGLALVALLASTAVSFLIHDKYTAESLIQVDLGRPLSPQSPQSSQAGTAVDTATIVESEARVIRSRAIARRVVRDLDLENDPAFAAKPGLLGRFLPASETPATGDETSAVERIAAEISRNLTVTNDTKAYLITVAYTASDPAQAARIANGIIEAYFRNRLEMGVNDAARMGVWLDGQIQSTRDALQQAEEAVERYRRETNLVEGGATSVSLPQQELRDTTVQLAAANQARISAEGRLTRAREVFATGGVPSAQDLAGAPVVQRMLENVETAKRELAALAQIGPRHPRLFQAKAALDDAEARLRTEIEQAIGNLQTDVRNATAEETALAARVATLKAVVIDGMGRETRLRGLQANATAIRDRLKSLNESHAQALALAGMKSSSAQVVMQAQPVPTPSGPNRPLIIGLSLFGTLGLGAIAALLMDRRDTGFRSDREVDDETALRCIGMVPAIHAASGPGEMRMFDEAIRFVSASLGWPRSATAPRVMLVTSCVPGEGKSLLALALAKLLAGRGIRTLVIDTASPRVRRTDQTATVLEDVVLGDQEAFLAGDHEPVRLLRGGGGPDAADVYAAPQFERFVARAREHFDLVLIEAPPAMLLLDFFPLAHHADTTLLVVRWGSTPRKTVLATLRRLQNLSVRVRGLVLTHVDLKEHKHSQSSDQCSYYGSHKQFFDGTSARATPPTSLTDGTRPDPSAI